MYYVKCVPCVALGSDTQGTHKTQSLILCAVLWSKNRNHYRKTAELIQKIQWKAKKLRMFGRASTRPLKFSKR